MKILVVEDDALLAEFIVRCLAESGFLAESENDGLKGFKKARDSAYDCIVLDINLPNMSGLDLCRQLRAVGDSTPIIFLSSFHTKDDRVKGLESGADDYLIKPFSHDELIARVKALTRRPAAIMSTPIKQGDLLIDVAAREVFVRGNGIKLTPKEFQLLEVLARHSDRVVTREYLLEYVWGVTVGHTSNRLEACVRNLRQKLIEACGHEYIETEYGVGYKLSSRFLSDM